ncbi:unnamed protein product [Didymodactylos carnosus]|uniref:Uncharacterized protein n=1 Tax=Didymodactylos carnosus TaxID=1234261 RepID=A0A8S2F4J1_9BILA|nr:unnamed protein product [Didymodactylos carnosus]CAF4197545.1 unnamed protein product [Didymodactylos carnosus]
MLAFSLTPQSSSSDIMDSLISEQYDAALKKLKEKCTTRRSAPATTNPLDLLLAKKAKLESSIFMNAFDDDDDPVTTASTTNVDSPPTNSIPPTIQDNKPNTCSSPSQDRSISPARTESSVNNSTASSFLTMPTNVTTNEMRSIANLDGNDDNSINNYLTNNNYNTPDDIKMIKQ